MSTASLPLFPLGTVLFPGGPLSLRIFEPRYLDMVGRCLKEQGCFGVLLILDGAETAAVVSAAAVGTTARIVDFDARPDGLLGIECIGERRFRVRRQWQQDDGLNLGEIDYLPDDVPSALPVEFAQLAELLREVLPKLGGGYGRIETHYEDAGWVANRWAEILPLSAAERLALLELGDPLARLAQVAVQSARQSLAADIKA
jgi:Lon protease-like protein